MQQYSDFILLLFGIGGILIHNLIKINELLKCNKFNPPDYFKYEWASIGVSLIIVILCIVGKHEVSQLEQAGKWLGLAFTTTGYMGQSVFVSIMGKASKKIQALTGSDEQEKESNK